MASKLNLRDISEVVAGMIIQGKVTPAAVRPSALMAPYDALVSLYMKKKKAPSTEDIIETIGPMAYDTAIMAAEKMKNLPASWPTLLETAASRREAGQTMLKYGQRLIDGEEIDVSPVQSALTRMDRNLTQLVPLSKVTADKNPFMLTGYEPLDTYLGGVPQAGLTVAAGRPGVGKTWLMLKIAAAFTHHHKKKAALFSLEMTAQQFMFRAKNLLNLPKETLDMIEICDDVLGVSEIASIASRATDVGFIGVDFAELLLEGDSQQSEQTMAYIYRSLAWVAKRLNIPVLLLSQLNRSNDSDVPNLNRLRYTGMAEALAALVLFLYNPTAIYDGGMNKIVKLLPDEAAIIAAKSRFGYKKGAPGYIVVPWTGAGGWGDQSVRWEYLMEQKATQ